MAIESQPTQAAWTIVEIIYGQRCHQTLGQMSATRCEMESGILYSYCTYTVQLGNSFVVSLSIYMQQMNPSKMVYAATN
jgi:hypothetical protein